MKIFLVHKHFVKQKNIHIAKLRKLFSSFLFEEEEKILQKINKETVYKRIMIVDFTMFWKRCRKLLMKFLRSAFQQAEFMGSRWWVAINFLRFIYYEQKKTKSIFTSTMAISLQILRHLSRNSISSHNSFRHIFNRHRIIYKSCKYLELLRS